MWRTKYSNVNLLRESLFSFIHIRIFLLAARPIKITIPIVQTQKSLLKKPIRDKQKNRK